MDIPERHQTKIFSRESWRYFREHGGRPSAPQQIFFPNSVPVGKGGVESLLDVGCGNGDFLKSWAKHYSMKRAVGVEPSRRTVWALKLKHKGTGLAFRRGSADSLPFRSGEFDLVTVWSVLGWVGRDNYLQALGELVRVTGKYLVVMDFVASNDYRVPYRHFEGLFTYKVDFEAPLVASGIMQSVERKHWWHNATEDEFEFVSRNDLTQFRGNPISYHARKMVVFEKNYALLPSLTESDFAPGIPE